MRKPKGKIRNPSLAKRVRRKLAIRKRVEGTSEKPRLCVTRSNKHLRVQVVDDISERTLFSLQTYGKNAVPGAKANKDGAKLLGQEMAKKLKEKKFTEVVFDRSGFKFAGVLKSLADAIKENGVRV